MSTIREMRTTFIYAHVMPFEDEIFYIGKADDPWGRLTGHRFTAKTKTHYQANKLRKLAAQGLEPRIEIIAEVPIEEWEFWEKHYIKYFRDLGFRLTNATLGGDGLGSGADHPCFGKPFSPEHCLRIGAANTGKVRSPEHLRKLRAGLNEARAGIDWPRIGCKGKPLSAAHRAKIGAARAGKHLSSATREKMSLARLGKVQSPETIAKRKATQASNQARVGVPLTPEHRANISAAGKGRKQSPEHVMKRIANMLVTRKKNKELRRAAQDKGNL